VILIDMPAWCRSTGHEYLGHRQEGGEYRLFVRKTRRVERQR
jgi:TusA-related sulfurtransferase